MCAYALILLWKLVQLFKKLEKLKSSLLWVKVKWVFLKNYELCILWKESNEQQCVEPLRSSKQQQLRIWNPSKKENEKIFAFDFVYGANCTQETIYNEMARPIVDSVLNGYNGTIFAYGKEFVEFVTVFVFVFVFN